MLKKKRKTEKATNNSIVAISMLWALSSGTLY